MYEPAARRRRYLALVARCPHCGGSHQHYANTLGDLLTGIRSGCGRAYRLRCTRLFNAGGVRHG
ncbi:hypothetical protein [Prauserella endophytica]|uniref:Uncharacterized protein n=1 Tax=Prauserella endophytica TaxID=1592324 RepID=A0ABY2RYU7_9PSEU|nr:hypothetical protein [Prauserella endophytica]TKG66186.1 hypothetical protein FCN18_25435 [Prauserella endophytica]